MNETDGCPVLLERALGKAAVDIGSPASFLEWLRSALTTL